MSDGQNGSEMQTEAAPAVAPTAAIPIPPSQQAMWAVPPETADMLRNLNGHCQGLLQKVGALEVDYLAAKQAALEELKSKRMLFKSVLDEAARKGGLDIDKTTWNLDMRNMTLVRGS